MKTGYTHMTLVVDASGSMAEAKNDFIGTFNQFLLEQQALPGEATATLVFFNSPPYNKSGNIELSSNLKLHNAQAGYTLVYQCRPLAQCAPLDAAGYVCRHGTPLYYATCRAIDETGAALAALPEEARPEKVLLVILTDGEENCSPPPFDQAKVMADKIEHQKTHYQWEVLFLGANFDVLATGELIGASAAVGMSSTEELGRRGMVHASSYATSYRTRPKEEKEEVEAPKWEKKQ